MAEIIDPAGYRWKLVPLERSYDMRVRAVIAFNTATKSGACRDDALQAAWEAEFHAAPQGRQKDNDLSTNSADGMALTVTTEALVSLLPGTYYMDPPDGGSVTLLEQLQRMARDAARYRWLRDSERVGEEMEGDILVGAEGGEDILWGKSMDRAIDAAMLADPTQDSEIEALFEGRAANKSVITANSAVNSRRAQVIARAVAAHGREWSEQLTSGVMFYDGERITKAEFMAEVRA